MRRSHVLLIVTATLMVVTTGTAQAWTVEEVYAWETGEGPSGLTLETHPITNTWALIYGIKEAQGNATIKLERTIDGGTSFHSTTLKQRTSSEQAYIEIGGASASKMGMVTCYMWAEVHTSTTDTIGIDLLYSQDAGLEHWEEHNHWSHQQETGDTFWPGPCDTGLARNGWQHPLATSLIFVGDSEAGEKNQTQWYILDDQGNTLAGPHTLAGEFQVGTDNFEYQMFPGWRNGPGMIIGDPKAPESNKCPSGIFRWTSCIIGRGITALGEWVGDVTGIRELLTVDEFQVRKVVDHSTYATAIGYTENPDPAYIVSLGAHSYADHENFPSGVLAQRTGLNLQYGDITMIGPYEAMVVWYDISGESIRFRMVGDGNPGDIRQAFEHDTGVRWMKIKSLDPGTSGALHIVGALVDNTGKLILFETKDRGNTWTTQEIVTNANIDDMGTGADNNAKTDIAYDTSRNRIIVAWTDNEGVKLAHKPYNLTQYAGGFARTNVALQALEQEEPQAELTTLEASQEQIAGLIGMDREPVGFLVYMTIVAAFAGLACKGTNEKKNRGPPQVRVNKEILFIGALGGATVISAVIGLIPWLITVPMTILFLGGYTLVGPRPVHGSVVARGGNYE